MKFKKPQQFIQQFASTSGSSLFAQIFSALTSLLILYGSILLLWLSYRLGKWSNFLGENTFTRDCPCVTSSLAPLVMYPFQRSKTTCAGKQRLLNHLTHLNAIQKKSKRGGSEFSFWRISPMRIFAQAKFRQSEISLLWDAKFCQDDSEIWNSQALGRILVMSFHRMFAKIKEIGEFRFIFARHHIRSS